MKKTALITGGNRGIGAGICTRLSQDGCDVAFAYLDGDEDAQRVDSESVAAGRRVLGAAQRHPAPDGAGPAPRARRDRRTAGRGAQPGGRGGGDDRVRRRGPPRRPVRARARPHGPHGPGRHRLAGRRARAAREGRRRPRGPPRRRRHQRAGGAPPRPRPPRRGLPPDRRRVLSHVPDGCRA